MNSYPKFVEDVSASAYSWEVNDLVYITEHPMLLWNEIWESMKLNNQQLKCIVYKQFNSILD